MVFLFLELTLLLFQVEASRQNVKVIPVIVKNRLLALS